MTNPKDPLFSEKAPGDYPDPLVLRPPVGSEVYGSPYVRFQDFFYKDAARRRRLLLLCSLGILITLALGAGLLFTMFLVGFGPKYPGTYFQRKPCTRKFKILLPSIHSAMEEQLLPMDGSLSATVAGIPAFPIAKILHLFEKGLTVVRLPHRCFVRRIRLDMSFAYENGYVQQLNEDADSLRGLSQATIHPQFWTLGPPEEINIRDDSHIAALCAGATIYTLVPHGAPNNLFIPSVLDNVEPPMPAVDQSSEDLLDAIPDPIVQGGNVNDDIKHLMDEIFRKNGPHLSKRIRRKASIVLVDNLRNQVVGRSSVHSAINTGKKRINCRVVSSFLEDATVPSNSSSFDQASVNLDVVLTCHPAD